MGLKIVEPPGHSRDQWEILRALSEECGVALPYNSLEELRTRIYSISPHLLKYDFIEPSVYGKIASKASSSQPI
jgi:NADH dehydrogenase/NADH:ubiquinone oxidoreductase subunit G